MLSTPREQRIAEIRSGPGLVKIILNYSTDIAAMSNCQFLLRRLSGLLPEVVHYRNPVHHEQSVNLEDQHHMLVPSREPIGTPVFYAGFFVIQSSLGDSFVGYSLSSRIVG